MQRNQGLALTRLTRVGVLRSLEILLKSRMTGAQVMTHLS
jgi:hypothetical protein